MSATLRPIPVSQAAPSTDDALSAAGRTALRLQAALLACRSVDEAAQVGVRELARRLSFSRVSMALAGDDGTLHLAARSDGAGAAAGSALEGQLLAALAEAFDQRVGLIWPDPAGSTGVPRITRALRVLAPTAVDGVAAVPLVEGGRAIGALCLERRGEGPISRDELRVLEHQACLLAPVLALLQTSERPWHHRLREAALRRWPASGDGRLGQRPLRIALGAGAAALAVLLLWPAEVSIGGQARLEGAVQRVLAVPADGFLQQVHARPGDRVRAGQVLVELADQDLQLERQRWQSQLAQHQDAIAAANANADRAQLVLHQSRADEAQAQLELVEARLVRGRLAAPFDGIVVKGDLSQQLGAPVHQGDELLTLAPGDQFRVIVEVDERDIAHIQTGQTGTLALTALPWQTLPLKVVRISPVARAVAGRNVFDVETELPRRPADLRPGLQGSARIAAGHAPTLWQWSRRLVESVRLLAWEWLG